MSTVKRPPAALARRRLAQAADLAGNKDGVATQKELAALDPLDKAQKGWLTRLEKDGMQDVRADLIADAGARGLSTLAPEIQKLPLPLRELALELDGLWGNSDGRVSAAELDRVAEYTLCALPFFVDDAADIIALADRLGFGAEAKKPVANVLNLRLAMSQLPTRDAEDAVPFRVLLDEALAQGEVKGLPDLLRDVKRHAPRYHSLSVLEHTATAVRGIDRLVAAAGADFPDASAIMLLHDVGKIIDRQLWTKEDGSLDGYSFEGHEAVGAEWLRKRGLDGEFVFHVKFHGAYRTMDEEAIVNLCGDKETLGEAMLVYIADALAKGNEPAMVASFEKEVDKIGRLLDRAGLNAEVVLGEYYALRDAWFGAAA